MYHSSMLDDLNDGTDLFLAVARFTWRVAGPFTFLLSFGALVLAVVDTLQNDTWLLAGLLTVLVGFVFGWLVDLLTLLVMRPLAKLAGFRPATWIGDLVLGLPIAVGLMLLLASQDWL